MLPRRGLMRRVHVLASGALVAVVVIAGCLVAGASPASSNVVPSGDARSFGSTGAVVPARPVVGMAPSRSGMGYWLVGSDGGVLPFNDAGHFGSLRGVKLAGPIVGMAASRSGRGYWLVGADGGVFAFGDAGFFGSLGGVRLNQPIVGIAASRSGRGYWLVGADGRVFTFGDAESLDRGRGKVARPIAGVAASRSGLGYWLFGSDGGVFPFGDAGIPLPSAAPPNFKPPVPGAPIIRAELDDTGLHFTPSHIECGVYNVAFSDTRTNRIPGTAVALHFEKTFPPYIRILSVHAGQTGGGLLGFGGVGWAVTVDGDYLGGVDSGSGQLIIDPPMDPTAPCATPIT